MNREVLLIDFHFHSVDLNEHVLLNFHFESEHPYWQEGAPFDSKKSQCGWTRGSWDRFWRPNIIQANREYWKVVGRQIRPRRQNWFGFLPCRPPCTQRPSIYVLQKNILIHKLDKVCKTRRQYQVSCKIVEWFGLTRIPFRILSHEAHQLMMCSIQSWKSRKRKACCCRAGEGGGQQFSKNWYQPSKNIFVFVVFVRNIFPAVG